jgi:hypothetical protein
MYIHIYKYIYININTYIANPIYGRTRITGTQVPLHKSSGRPLLGLDGCISSVTIAWRDSEACLSLIVERANHLPKALRFGLCDAQVLRQHLYFVDQ